MNLPELSLLAANRRAEATDLIDRLLRLGLEFSRAIATPPGGAASERPATVPAIGPAANGPAGTCGFAELVASFEEAGNDAVLRLSPAICPVGISWEDIAGPGLEGIWPPKTDKGDPFGDLIVHAIATLEAKGTSVVKTHAITGEIASLMSLPRVDKTLPDSVKGFDRLKGKVASKLGKLAEGRRINKDLDGNNHGVWSLPRPKQRVMGGA